MSLSGRFGERAGLSWRTLPGVIDELGGRWALMIGAPVGESNYFAGAALSSHRRAGAMFKLTPEPGLPASEAAALSSWATSGRITAIWAYDADRGALSLEAISSERPLLESVARVLLSELAALLGGRSVRNRKRRAVSGSATFASARERGRNIWKHQGSVAFAGVTRAGGKIAPGYQSGIGGPNVPSG